MKTAKRLFSRLVDPEHLDEAARLAARGKRRRPDVAWFEFRRDAVLESIRSQLTEGHWTPSPGRSVFVRDPKPRAITHTSIEDRIVHRAVAMLLEPLILRSASEADFACRPGWGTHRAVLELMRLMRRHRHVLHLDLRSYFPSIDREIVRRQLTERVSDRRFLAVVDRILDAGQRPFASGRIRRFARIDRDWPPAERGLPIGTATSQLFAAHLYLQQFDHDVKRRLRVRGYVRYVDDLFLFGCSRRQLEVLRSEVAQRLDQGYGARLKRPNAPVLPCRGALDALGFRIRQDGVEPLPAAWRRFRGRVGEYVRAGKRGGQDRLLAQLASSAGHLMFG